MQPLKILFVSAEVAPFAKVGGLADVAGALPKALAQLGHEVRVLMPLYGMIQSDPRWELEQTVDWFDVNVNSNWKKRARYCELKRDGVTWSFVGSDTWFNDSTDSETVYRPGGIQHLFLSAAILQILDRINWIPDVIHCNDWHTGFLPVLMRYRDGQKWDRTASVFTIHNFAYQGEFGLETLDTLDLPRSLFNSNEVEAYGQVNFLKSGCVFADEVNTVSPTYAQEIQTSQYGNRLEGFMQWLAGQHRLTGILNGIDTDVFNPATDLDIAAHFDADHLDGKDECRRSLLEEVGMEPIAGAPLLGMVTRISGQKGLNLVMEAAESMFSLPVQMIIQGLGEPDLVRNFKNLEKDHPKHFRYIERFDAPLAQRVYAGSDAFLMPSSFEPCGLGQLIAMRYGTVPVVRKTGGLADTVFEGINGFSFERQAPMDFLAAVVRAFDAYGVPAKWQQLVHAGMTTDHSWTLSASHYMDLYERAILARQSVAVAAS
ncbi:glycogen synthase GlgA [soil metagenome]